MSDNDKLGVILNLITSVDQRLHGMDQRLDKIEHDGAETRATAMASRAEARETQIAINNLQTEATETRVAIMARIDRLQNLVVLMRDDIGVNFGRADRAVDAALGVRNHVDAVRSQVDAVRKEVDALGREVSAMERQIQGLQSQVRELQERGGQ